MGGSVSTRRGLPNDPQAEMAIIGLCIMYKHAADKAIEELEKNDFYFQENRIVFSIISDARKEGMIPDLVVTSSLLEQKGEFERVGGSKYLSECMDLCVTDELLDSYISIVKKKSRQRALIMALRNKAEELYSEDADVSNVGTSIVTEVENIILKDSTLETAIPMNIVAKRFIDYYEERKKRLASNNRVDVSFGLKALDNMTGGIPLGELTIVTGETNGGKTILATHIAMHACQSGIPTLFCSLEMNEVQLAGRIVSNIAEVNGMVIRSGDLDQDEEERVMDAIEKIEKWKMWIDPTPSPTPEHIMALARRKYKEGMRLLVVDYVGLMAGYENLEARHEAIAHYAMCLKRIAKELDIAVIAVSQMRKSVGRARTNEDVSGSKDLVNHAALIVNIHGITTVCDEDTVQSSALPADKPRRVALFVMKNRYGGTGVCHCDFVPAYAKLMDSKDVTIAVQTQKKSSNGKKKIVCEEDVEAILVGVSTNNNPHNNGKRNGKVNQDGDMGDEELSLFGPLDVEEN